MKKIKAVKNIETIEDRIAKALEMTDFDVVVKYNYINGQLEDICDEYLEVNRKIAENEIEIDICNRLNADHEANVIKLENDRLENRLGWLDAREEVLLDLQEEMIVNLLV